MLWSRFQRGIASRVAALLPFLVLLLGSGGVLPSAHVAAATTYTVNVTTDTGAGSGTTGDLRYAINQANAGSGGDTITITATGTIMLTNELPDLVKNVTITGPGANLLAIDGGCTGCEPGGTPRGGLRIFFVHIGVTVALNGLTLQHGHGVLTGGSIENRDGSLTITNCTFRDNNTASGGAIWSEGILTVMNTIFAGNTAGGGGGGIATNGGTVRITDSTFSNNSAGNHNSTGAGGGINNGGTLTVSASTFSNNSALSGAGIFSAGPLTVTSSTFSGNSAPNGGIRSFDTAMITNTIVAGSTDGDLTVGPFVGNNNLIDDSTISLLSGSNNLNVPPMLGTLGNYGGPTQTIPLLPGSPAINAGASIGSGPSDNPVPATDQRGLPRIGVPDIGAFEVQDVTCAGSTPISIKVGQTIACNASVQSSDPTIVAVVGSGNITGERAGQVTLTVTQGGVTGTVTVIVTGPTPIGISVPPAPQSRPSGATSGSGAPSPAPAPRSVPGAAPAGSMTGATPNPAPPQR